MHFGLTIHTRYSVPKLAYAEDLHEFAPGHILVHAVLEDLLARGVDEFDFLGNQMDWKREWTPLVRQYQRVHIFNRTTCGIAAARMRYSLLPRVRQMRNRLVSTQTKEVAG
jgi:CelD/BcsL family acetyltransferase involved in cellulose biosynthesis